MKVNRMPDVTKQSHDPTYPDQPGSSVGVAKSTRVLVIRLLDQVLWSSGFFLFNLTSALTLPTGTFAALAVSTTIGTIVAAAIRAFSAEGRLIAAARLDIGIGGSIDPKTIWKAAGVGSICAVSISAVWLYLAPESNVNWMICALAGSIIWADLPHYLLVLLGKYKRALSIGALYSVVAASTLISGTLLDSEAVIISWLCITTLLSASGLVQVQRLGLTSERFEHRGVNWRLGAESLYSSLGTQIGTLVIFVIAEAAVTGGIRLAQSVVFAPVLMIIQSLQPIFIRRMAELHRKARGGERKLAVVWTSTLGACLIGVALLAWISMDSFAWVEQFLQPSLPYLVPVGATMLGSLAFDASLSASRFRLHPKVPHRIRLCIVSTEVLLQLSGIIIAGSLGLVIALIIAGCVKFCIGALMLIVIRRSRPGIVAADLPVD